MTIPDNDSSTDSYDLQRGRKRHRSYMRWRLMLPLGAVGALIVVIPVALLLALGGKSFRVTADTMSLCVMLPLTLLCFVPYAALLSMTWGLARLHSRTSSIMGGVHRTAHRANVMTQGISRRIAAPVISMNARFTQAERILNVMIAKPESELEDGETGE